MATAAAVEQVTSVENKAFKVLPNPDQVPEDLVDNLTGGLIQTTSDAIFEGGDYTWQSLQINMVTAGALGATLGQDAGEEIVSLVAIHLSATNPNNNVNNANGNKNKSNAIGSGAGINPNDEIDNPSADNPTVTPGNTGGIATAGSSQIGINGSTSQSSSDSSTGVTAITSGNVKNPGINLNGFFSSGNNGNTSFFGSGNATSTSKSFQDLATVFALQDAEQLAFTPINQLTPPIALPGSVPDASSQTFIQNKWLSFANNFNTNAYQTPTLSYSYFINPQADQTIPYYTSLPSPQNNEDNNNWIDLTHIGLGSLGITAGGGEFSNVMNNMWQGLNQKWYFTYFNGNGVTGGISIAQEAAENYHLIGLSAFVFDTGLGIIEIIQDIGNNNILPVGPTSFDITMGAIGTFRGPVGWGLSAAYFIPKWTIQNWSAIQTAISISGEQQQEAEKIVGSINYMSMRTW